MGSRGPARALLYGWATTSMNPSNALLRPTVEPMSFDASFDVPSHPTGPRSDVRMLASFAVDWEAQVRAAFLDQCVRQGVRAGLLLEGLRHARHPRVRRRLLQALHRAAHRASFGWSEVDRLLA